MTYRMENKTGSAGHKSDRTLGRLQVDAERDIELGQDFWLSGIFESLDDQSLPISMRRGRGSPTKMSVIRIPYVVAQM